LHRSSFKHLPMLIFQALGAVRNSDRKASN
jgi:hypothetical protein